MAASVQGKVNREELRVFARDVLHLFALSAFAIAQPLFDQLSRHTEFFVARGSKPMDISLLAIFLCLAPPLLLGVLEGSVGLISPRWRKRLHLALMGVLLALFGMVAAKSVGVTNSLPLTAFAVALGLVGSWFYARKLERLTSLWAPLFIGLLFPALFLFHSPAKQVAFPDEVPQTTTTSTPIENPVPIILVILDELDVTALMNEDREIDSIRYPNFARLAEHTTWFPNAVTVSAQTTVAIPVILSGRLPEGPANPSLANHPGNLFSWLEGAYDLQVMETQTQLCPEGACGLTPHQPLSYRMKSLLADVSVVYPRLIFPEAWTKSLPEVTATWQGFVDIEDAEVIDYRNEPVAAFTDFTDAFDNAAQSTLYFLHVGLPHIPYRYLPSGSEYGPYDLGFFPHGVGHGPWVSDDWHGIQGYQRYLLQLGYTDKLLGQMIDRLQDRGLFDRSLLIVLSDHGVSFTPGSHRRHASQENYAEVLPIPLFLKLPGQKTGEKNLKKAQIIDVLPTIAEVLETQPPWSYDGVSLLSEELVNREFLMFRANGSPPESFPDPVDEKYRVLQRKMDLFGSGKESLFRLGSFKQLVESSSTKFPMGQPAPIEIELDHPRIVDPVDLEARVKPFHVSGRVLGTQAAEVTHLAIALNGQIEAVTRTWPDHGHSRFTAMLPEQAIRSGQNEVEFFVVQASFDSKGFSLHPIALDNQSDAYELVSQDGSESLRSKTDGLIPVVKNPGRGHLDGVSEDKETVKIWGWAADLDSVSPCEKLIIFVQGKYAFSGRPNKDRRDVVKFLSRQSGLPGHGFLGSGFHFELDRSLFSSDDLQDVRIFSLSSGGRATELHYYRDYPWHLETKPPTPDAPAPTQVSARYQLALLNGREHLVHLETAQELLVHKSDGTGHADGGADNGDSIRIWGWAADVENQKPAHLITVFSEGQFVFAAPPDTPRKDVLQFLTTKKGYAGDFLSSGFDFSLDRKLFVNAELTDIRLFSVSHSGTVRELYYSPEYPWRRKIE